MSSMAARVAVTRTAIADWYAAEAEQSASEAAHLDRLAANAKADASTRKAIWLYEAAEKARAARATG